MKKIPFLLLLVCALFSCSGNKKDTSVAVCTINGRYASAPDGTMLYMTPVDDILSPVDSAVVKGGHFSFAIPDSTVDVRFISSQQVIDGGYVVVEPGVVDVDFTGDAFVSGTPANDRLSRFMSEKVKIVNLRKMATPEILGGLAVEESMLDSIKELVTMANDIFDAYVLKEIKENIGTPVGYFYLVQSVGVATASRLQPLFDKVPLEYRDKLYDIMKSRVDQSAKDAAMAKKYADDALKNLEATAVGKRFQNFELNNINGGTMLLSGEVFSNKYTLVLFWAGWMDDARGALLRYAELYDKYRKQGLQVVGVSLDDSVAECQATVDELALIWPQLCNPSGGSAEVAAAYGVTELPAAVIINNRGTILSRPKSVEEAAKKLDELFK